MEEYPVRVSRLGTQFKLPFTRPYLPPFSEQKTSQVPVANLQIPRKQKNFWPTGNQTQDLYAYYSDTLQS